MYQKIIVLFLLLCNLAITDSRVLNIESKQGDIFPLFLECANGETSACKKILEYGFSSKDECGVDECAIIGATLYFAQKESQAISYLTKACNMGKVQSCTSLGLLYQNNNDLNNAKYFYSSACNHNDTIACYNLGMLYTSKDLLGDNPQIATDYFKKSCRAFYPKACYNIAVLYATKQPNNPSLARFYFDKSCDLGNLQSCKNAESLRKTGIQMPQPQKYRALYIHE